MLVRTLTDKALLITASKVRYKKANTKFLAKFIFICSAKNSFVRCSSKALIIKEWGR